MLTFNMVTLDIIPGGENVNSGDWGEKILPVALLNCLINIFTKYKEWEHHQ